jgi:TatD DNase family protein
MIFVDSHAHLNAEDFDDDRSQVIERALKEDIKAILCPAELTESKNLEVTHELIDKFPEIVAAAGVHPHNADKFHPECIATMKRMADDKKIFAIGEIGLDFYYNFSSPEKQIDIFRSQLNIAQDLNLPVLIHSREAADEIVRAITEEDFTRGGVLHCFTEKREFAEKMLERDFLISFSGILTYPNAQALRDAAIILPLEKILIETDSPYLVPSPYRGRIRRNEPVYVKEVAKVLADIRKIDLAEIARITTANFASLFPFEI